MQDQPIQAAFDRIERALARLDRAADARPDPADQAELEQLRAAHARLRARVEEAIGGIDRLLADDAEGRG